MSLPLRRAAFRLSRRQLVAPPTRSFSTSFLRRSEAKHDSSPDSKQDLVITADKPPSARLIPFEEVKSEADLYGPGAPVGTIPTDLEQATGLERLEILGKMQGVDIFDMTPLDASRRGTLDDPIIIKSFGQEQFAGCTGFPADSHDVLWLCVTEERPVERCPECGSVYKMEYVGPPHEDEHGHGHEGGDGHHDEWPELKDGRKNYHQKPDMADYLEPEYLIRAGTG